MIYCLLVFLSTYMMDKKLRALENARQDLCFAIQHMSDSASYSDRLFGTVLFITRVLDDKEEFIKYMRKNQMKCPECCEHNYLRKCELHGV